MIGILKSIKSITEEEIKNEDYSRFFKGNYELDKAISEEIQNYV